MGFGWAVHTHDMGEVRIMGRRRVNEPIAMLEKRFGYFPRVFLWHGHCYDVEAVERCWTHPTRHYFRVRCAEGIFDLYQDVRINTWHLERMEEHTAPLAASKMAPAWW